MKKLSVLVFLLILSINTSFAEIARPEEFWKKIPKDFKENCYEETSDIKILEQYTTYKINYAEKIDTFISNDIIIPHKLFRNAWENIDYSIDLKWDRKYLQDNNSKTSLELDTSRNYQILISFDDLQKAWTFILISNIIQIYLNQTLKFRKTEKNIYLWQSKIY